MMNTCRVLYLQVLKHLSLYTQSNLMSFIRFMRAEPRVCLSAAIAPGLIERIRP